MEAIQKQLRELSVQITQGKNKRPRANNQRVNIWCSNCKGHGHLSNECISPIGSAPVLRCTYCGAKGHDITTCRNIKEVKGVVALVQEQPSQTNQNKQKIPYRVTSKRPFTRPNKGPPYVAGDGRLDGMMNIISTLFGMDHLQILILIDMDHLSQEKL